ncbi:hypothetical protein FEM48_Zijuj11G0009300 [Ziziphus jujuba var. spinosa]|uniref:5'-3' DNA helicase ZGRF1-like N-terminal domain-containing protein n=1 Tax=Ziziphus jujuba var. spinosa TaxID=714518 RepID=A0A978UFX3_ZIZJJ|nr:hypothetical protein FEM48_Zijuj11G0009300 [Ziziphus jujuba var. spinosa]
MEDVKRWSVTYTKHLKQKRKVYQDGLLDLHTPTNKLLLYDDCEKLLECRMLKKDEVVSCGETLTFNAYLVDVNASEGDQKPATPASTSFARDCKIVGKNKLRPTLSPSQKIIRDFKKREVRKYATTPTATSPDFMESNTREWEVLYTTQITQKAKKYHDGFLQLSTRGSFGRQVMLYDASRNLLDSRFLKNDEVIESGEAIALDAHLVEIGENQGDHKVFKENNCNVNKETGTAPAEHHGSHVQRPVEKGFIKNEFNKFGASHSSRGTTGSSTREWNVMYTTQLTQKAKKYHDGFLQLANCGLRGRQVMLYDLTRKLIDSRFLKKEELIESGESLAFATHLVDIGEPEVKKEPPDNLNVQGKCFNVLQKTGKMHRQQEHLAVNNIVLKGRPHTNSSSGKDVDLKILFSNANKTKANEKVPIDKPLPSQILSILQKPRAQISMVEDDTNGSTTRSVSPTKEPPVSDVVDLHFPEDDGPPSSSLAHQELSENVDAKESRENVVLKRPPEVASSKGKFYCNLFTLHHLVLYSDNMEADTSSDEVNASNRATSATCASYGDDDRKKSEELTCARETVEGPSFDLGF